jgi:hypothetical protein
MTNNKLLFIVMLLLAVTFTGFSANAADFYGANVTDREVPTVAWRAGITGDRPIVGDVSINSPAEKHGLKRGDIIISVNGKDVRTTNELSQFKTDTISVRVFDGTEMKTLSIDRLAIEKEKAERIDVERKEDPPPPKIVPDEPSDNLPPMEFNDEILYKRTISPTSDETK